jgi:hypothetical protein
MGVLNEKKCKKSKYCFNSVIYFCKTVLIAVVANKNKPALNDIFASNPVNVTLLNGLNRYIKNKLTYILT